MTKFEILKRILGACALSVAAVGFAGSACEKQNRTNPVTETAQQVPNPTHTGSQTAAQNDVVKPDDVGPAAPALFVVSGLKGYTEPCGCTIDIMLGGIDRIVRYANDASKLYPASALVDGGDLFFDFAGNGEDAGPEVLADVVLRDVVSADDRDAGHQGQALDGLFLVGL